MKGRLKTIEEFAFTHCDKLTDLVIPVGVTAVGEKAFMNCSKLKRLVIPESVTEIGKDAFLGCETLRYTKKNKLKYLGSVNHPYEILAKADTDINEVTIESGCETIGYGAFSDCGSLTSIIIPSNVKRIDGSAFSNCYGLERVDFGEGITEIGINAFSSCALSRVVVPQGVTTLAGVFYNCKRLESVVLPHGLEKIGSSTFANCINLKSLNIPKSVIKIDSSAFYGCQRLTKFTVDSENSAYKVVDDILYDKKQTVLVRVPPNKRISSLVLNKDLTAISAYAVERNGFLQSVIIPESVKNIGKGAFSDCCKLTYIKIPQAVTMIEESVFQGCASLTRIDFSATLEEVKSRAFSRCNGLTNVILPSSVKRIGVYSFAWCNKLETVSIPSGIERIESGAFENSPKLKYNKKDGLKYLGNKDNPFVYLEGITDSDIVKAKIESGCRDMSLKLFEDKKRLEYVIIPQSITRIYKTSFFGCVSLNAIFYEGTSEEFYKKVSSGFTGHEKIFNAVKKYFYSQTAPAEKGAFWRYGEDGTPIIW